MGCRKPGASWGEAVFPSSLRFQAGLAGGSHATCSSPEYLPYGTDSPRNLCRAFICPAGAWKFVFITLALMKPFPSFERKQIHGGQSERLCRCSAPGAAEVQPCGQGAGGVRPHPAGEQRASAEA